MNTGFGTKNTAGFRGKNQKDFSHPSVIALLREAGVESDPEVVVRKKCRDIVSRAKKDGWSGPPFNPIFLASLLGIKVKEVTCDIGAEARIFGTPSQVVIQYRPDLSLEERIRFSIFHEIVHTIFPDCFKTIRYSQPTGTKLTEAESEFERLVDVGAGELLMPHEDFLPDFKKTAFNLKDVCDLKKRYFASTEAAVKRCLGITDQSRAAVFFHRKDEQLVVKFYWKSCCFRPFIKPGLVPPSNSVIHKVSFETGGEPPVTIAQNEVWFSDGRATPLHVQAVALPQLPQFPDYAKAMALIAHQ